MRSVVWLGVQPVPYNSFFLGRLKGVPELAVQVYYALPTWGGLPWKTRLADPEDRFFRRLLGVDWGVMRKAVSDRDTLFVVAGWEELTKVLVIVVRGLLRHPFVVWTDTVPLENTLRSRLKRWMLPPFLRRAAALLATGEVGVRSLVQSGLAPRGVKLVNFPFWVPLPDLSQRSYAPGGMVRFLCAGRLVAKKGFDRVIEAFRQAVESGRRSPLLRVAGTGPEEHALRAKVEHYGLQGQIVFLGWVEPDQMQRLRLESDVLIHVVSVLDPFPVSVLEAMACGMAVVGSREAGSVAERVESGVNGLVVDSEDADELARAIGRLAEEPEEAARMGRSARATAEAWPPERGVETLLGLLCPSRVKGSGV